MDSLQITQDIELRTIDTKTRIYARLLHDLLKNI